MWVLAVSYPDGLHNNRPTCIRIWDLPRSKHNTDDTDCELMNDCELVAGPETSDTPTATSKCVRRWSACISMPTDDAMDTDDTDSNAAASGRSCKSHTSGIMHEDDTMDTDDTDSNAIAGERSCKSHTSDMMHENEQCGRQCTIMQFTYE